MVKKTSCLPLSALLLFLGLFNPAMAQEAKVSYGVLIDNTGSLRSQLNDVLTIAKGVVEFNYQKASIALFNFRSDGDQKKPVAVVASGTGWTQDKVRLNDYLDNLYIVPGQTTLKDAINAIAQELNTKASVDKTINKSIVIISDGEDRASKIKETELIKTLKDGGIRVYAIGLTRELDDDDDAKSFLKKLTHETGGRVIFPKSIPINVDDMLRALFAT